MRNVDKLKIFGNVTGRRKRAKKNQKDEWDKTWNAMLKQLKEDNHDRVVWVSK